MKAAEMVTSKDDAKNGGESNAITNEKVGDARVDVHSDVGER